MIINKANYHGSRGSSSRAKKLEAANKISFARFNSSTSASRSLIFFASSVVVPGRWPELTAACLTQLRNVSALTPLHCAIRITAPFNDNSEPSFRASSTSRNIRSRNSCGYLLCTAIVLIRPGNQTLRQTRGGSNIVDKTKNPSRATRNGPLDAARWDRAGGIRASGQG